MATQTYDFDGLTAPSTTHLAYYGKTTADYPPTPPAGTEFTGAGVSSYPNIWASDDVWAVSNVAAGDTTNRPYEMFGLYAPAKGIVYDINFQVEGYNAPTGADPALFKGWAYNRRTSAWDTFGSHDGAADQTLTASYTGLQAADYYNKTTGYLWFGVTGQLAGVGPASMIQVDYCVLTIKWAGSSRNLWGVIGGNDWGGIERV